MPTNSDEPIISHGDPDIWPSVPRRTVQDILAELREVKSGPYVIVVPMIGNPVIFQEEKTFEREIWEKIAKKFHQKESKKATKKEPKHG